jgi:hypothetical protein
MKASHSRDARTPETRRCSSSSIEQREAELRYGEAEERAPVIAVQIEQRRDAVEERGRGANRQAPFEGRVPLPAYLQSFRDLFLRERSPDSTLAPGIGADARCVRVDAPAVVQQERREPAAPFVMVPRLELGASPCGVGEKKLNGRAILLHLLSISLR